MNIMHKKNLRSIKCNVTAQTLYHLQMMAAIIGTNDLGRVIDKLTREKMISLKINKIYKGEKD